MSDVFCLKRKGQKNRSKTMTYRFSLFVEASHKNNNDKRILRKRKKSIGLMAEAEATAGDSCAVVGSEKQKQKN